MQDRHETTRRLAAIEERIAEACARCGRSRAEITLLAVTKTKPLEDVLLAYELGLRHFGENRVQEAEKKFPGLPADARKHLIGPLQSNKVNRAVRLFDFVQTVDSLNLAEKLAHAAEAAGKSLDVLVEVNTGGEVTKAGLPPGEVPQLVERLRELPPLQVRGLMTIPPPFEARLHFRALKVLAVSLGLVELSMGMSGDFEEAIEEGATIIRIGTALFGVR